MTILAVLADIPRADFLVHSSFFKREQESSVPNPSLQFNANLDANYQYSLQVP
jgi:hypothetical protein